MYYRKEYHVWLVSGLVPVNCCDPSLIFEVEESNYRESYVRALLR
jgi:hypothetical protein